MIQNLNLLEVDVVQGISVTFTGIVVVFGMLILLVFVLFLFGKFFDNKPKTEKAPKVKAPVVKKEVKPAPVAPDVQNNEEIVAVIAAAVAAMYEGSDVKPVIRRIKKSGGNVRPAWTAAGIFENTRSF